MKKIRLLYLIGLSVFATTLFSCKKEVSPRLKVTVVDAINMPLPGTTVSVKARGTENASLSSEFDKVERTDNQGNAFFQFKNTVLITIIATRGSQSDSTFALLEVKRLKKDDENLTEKKIVLD